MDAWGECYICFIAYCIIKMNEDKNKGFMRIFILSLEGNRYRYLSLQTMRVAIFLTSAKQILCFLPIYERT